MGDPLYWGESFEGQLGRPNPSANLIGVNQAYNMYSHIVRFLNYYLKGEIRMTIVLKLAIIIGLGYIFGKLATLIKLPSVSGYLIAGLVVGLLPIDLTGDANVLNTISQITLSFIAFGIGSEFVLSELKKSGKQIFIITIFEVVTVIALVFLVMFLLVPSSFPKFTGNERIAFSLIIATMSAATAPAATIMVIRQFRTKGPVTDTILPVAALDDVLGIIAFGIALPIARILVPLSTETALAPTFWNIVRGPIIEVGGSIILGLALGFVLSLVSKMLDPRDELQVKTIFFVLLALGLSNLLGLSPLLVGIVMGATLANLRTHANRSFRIINDFVPVFYILFFAIAGANLNLKVLSTVGLIGIIYVIARAAGKIGGAYMGSVVSKAEPNIRKYLGFALLPQGGISIGLSLLVTMHMPLHISTPINTIILFSILIYESTGPIFAKIALSKSGELYMADIEPEEIDD